MEKKSTVIALTGASGHMGKETLKSLMSSTKNYVVKILVQRRISDFFFALKNKIKYGKRLKVIFGDILDPKISPKFIKDSSYVLHLAAIIPPVADHKHHKAVEVNYGGTKNLINAVKEQEKDGKTISFVYISSVAVYGERNLAHPWGQVGDPIIPSVFDVYAQSKAESERYLYESGLKRWMVLRQSGILYYSLLNDNISDGLMFHTGWNTPIEWVTDRDSGTLMKNIVDYDLDGKKGGWYNTYNIGGGAPMRTTGYETFDAGFKLIGGSTEKFFEPYYNKDRNFHCIWFYDGKELDDLYHFQSTSFEEFWAQVKKKLPYYKIAAILPSSLIKNLVIKPLLYNSNSPEYWVKHHKDPLVFANFRKGYKEYEEKIHWENQPIISKDYVTEQGYTYQDLLDESRAEERGLTIKPIVPKKDLADYNLDDLKKFAEDRGGRCLSEKWLGLHEKHDFECAEGHKFSTTPYTVIRGGFWCPECQKFGTWNYDKMAKTAPFYAVWYDSHDKDEDTTYTMDGDGNVRME